MAGVSEDLVYRMNWMRDEQSRTNLGFTTRIKALEEENKDLRNRLTVLTRLLISKQLASAEEIASALAATMAPPPAEDKPVSQAPTEGDAQS